MSTASERFVPSGTFDEFEIVRKLGEGAMGQVFLCRDLKLERLVAVKFLRHAARDEEVKGRFWIEARAIARLSLHPNVGDGVPPGARWTECRTWYPSLSKDRVLIASTCRLRPVGALTIGLAIARGLVARAQERRSAS